jgi:hypothetical protein
MENQATETEKIKTPLPIKIISYMGFFVTACLIIISIGLCLELSTFDEEGVFFSLYFFTLAFFVYFLSNGIRKLEKSALSLYSLVLLFIGIFIYLFHIDITTSLSTFFEIPFLCLGIYFLTIYKKFSGFFFDKKFFFGLTSFIVNLIIIFWFLEQAVGHIF